MMIIVYLLSIATIAKLSAMAHPTTDKAFANLLEPAVSQGGFKMDGYWVWGMSVVRGDDGLYHGYASRWPKSVPFAPNWLSHSQIVHATSPTPEGPYAFQGVVFERRGPAHWDGMATHNPTIRKSGDTYLLYYIGITYDFEPPGSSLTQEQKAEARASQRIGLATSKSPWGPWERLPHPILEPKPGAWDAYMTTNPAPVLHEDGSVLLIYKSAKSPKGVLKLGAARAESPIGPYRRLSDKPILDWENPDPDDWSGSRHLEDPYAWKADGKYQMIAKDMSGMLTGQKGAGVHAWSKNGVDWSLLETPLAYTRAVRWDDGKRRVMAALERPQLLFEEGRPSHAFFATGVSEKGEYWNLDETWNICIPLSRGFND